VADGDRRAGSGKAGSKQASSLRNRGLRWLLSGDRRSSTTERKGFRKPMLYPLSYEGLQAWKLSRRSMGLTWVYADLRGSRWTSDVSDRW
jgi:hypothetical protein